MPNTEDIEARLCEYIDGALDDAGRAEIEKHLESNPQHRQLIAELSEQRQFLRDLPRERAPGDVTETLHGQLERSALLGAGAGDESDVILRINRWPQIRAAAAVLLLVFSLVAVVYYVIPKPRTSSSDLAALVSGSEEDSISASDVPALSTTLPAGALGAPGVLTGSGQPDVIPSEQLLRTQMTLRDFVPRGFTDFTSNTVPPDQQIIADALEERGITRRRVAGATLHVEVLARDPFETGRQVQQYLEDNRFQPRVVAVEMPQPLRVKEGQAVHGSRLQEVGVQLKSLPTTNEAKDDNLDEGARADADTLLKAEPMPQQTIRVAGMSRQDVDAMCRRMSDPAAGQRAAVVRESLHSPLDAALVAPGAGGAGDPFRVASPPTQPSDSEDALPHRSAKEAFTLGGAGGPAGTDHESAALNVVIVVRSPTDETAELNKTVPPSEPATQPRDPSTAPASDANPD